MSDHNEDDPVLDSVHRILKLMREIERETAALARVAMPSGLDFQWAAVAAWRTEAELRLAETLADVGIVNPNVGHWAEYRATVAKALAALQGPDAGARYLARWDQVEARSLALADGNAGEQG